VLRGLYRSALLFYAFVALCAIAYAWLFGVLDRLAGEAAPRAMDLFAGAGVGLAIVALCHLAHRASAAVRRAGDAFGELVGPITTPQALVLALVSGVSEEILFRGALWPHFGLLGTSIVFGLLHILPVRALALYPLFAFAVGLVFGWLRGRSSSVAPPAVAHVVVNALNLAWLGARERGKREAPPERRPPPPFPSVPPPPIEGPYPATVWRYHLRVELSGTDRETLPQCLEGEELGIFRTLPRERAAAQIAEGELSWTGAFLEPQPWFANDVASISAYLFEIVTGIEVAERFVAEDVTDDVRAWKVVARRGEWVRVPLDVEARPDGTFAVDPDREDLEVVEARWADYPRWFQDGMRFKYPRLRAL
jgi:membrane protease YdiL (CAAX protease family)